MALRELKKELNLGGKDILNQLFVEVKEEEVRLLKLIIILTLELVIQLNILPVNLNFSVPNIKLMFIFLTSKKIIITQII